MHGEWGALSVNHLRTRGPTTTHQWLQYSWQEPLHEGNFGCRVDRRFRVQGFGIQGLKIWSLELGELGALGDTPKVYLSLGRGLDDHLTFTFCVGSN